MMKANELYIVRHPHPALRKRCEAVVDFTGIPEVSTQMLRLLAKTAAGVGLAAPQVGLNCRMFVWNMLRTPSDGQVIINPTLYDMHGSNIADEGCLSFPNLSANVLRATSIRMRGFLPDSTPVDLQSKDAIEARVWQHECDHLDGITILTRMSASDRIMNKRAIAALERR